MCPELRCHYCGAVYGSRRAAGADALARHIETECPDVSERVRQSYRSGCAFGNCDV